jgi:hypothetical protein
MQVKSLLIITAILGFIFGLGYLLFPGQLLAFFGLEVSEAANFAARFMGGAVFGYGILAWSARNAEGSATRRAIKLALFFTFLIGFILTLIGQLSGYLNAYGWIGVVIFFLLMLGFAHFRFLKPHKA